MILEFSVQNFRSFRDKQTFSMLADTAKSEFSENIIEFGKGIKVLKSAVIYGANASGKSNLMKAFQALRNLVLSSGNNTPKDDLAEYDPFKFNPDISLTPTQFELVFVHNNTRFSYSVSILRDRVVSEKLFFFPQGREAKLFIRSGQEFEFGDYLKGQKAVIAELTTTNQLFLSKAAQNNLKELTEVFFFFQFEFYTVPFLDKWIDSRFSDLIAKQIIEKGNNVSFVEKFKSLLRSFDTGIEDFKIKKRDLQYSFDNDSEYEIYTQHILYNSDGRKVGKIFHQMKEESEGTQKLFVLGALILKALMDGRTFLIDEFERSLHPYISKYILQMFHDPKINTKGAQLIIATHDSNLLQRESRLRRDQIWIVQKDNQGASEIFAVSDFADVRPENPYEKWYLNGKFGGVPGIENLDFELNFQNEAAYR